MSGTYLVCDLCGQFGPPAAFFFKDGIRLCYQCFHQDNATPTKPAPAEYEQETDQTPPKPSDPAQS